MKLPGLNLDPPDLNPVHCCVCVNTGNQSAKAETIVKGYAVCREHSVGLDEAGSLCAYLDAHRAATVREVHGV